MLVGACLWSLCSFPGSVLGLLDASYNICRCGPDQTIHETGYVWQVCQPSRVKVCKLWLRLWLCVVAIRLVLCQVRQDFAAGLICTSDYVGVKKLRYLISPPTTALPNVRPHTSYYTCPVFYYIHIQVRIHSCAMLKYIYLYLFLSENNKYVCTQNCPLHAFVFAYNTLLYA